MPSDLVAGIFKLIVEVLLYITGYYTARLLFPLVSFGHISVAPTKKLSEVFPRWCGFNRASNGKIVLHEDTGALFGILVWAILIVVIVYAFWRS